MSDLVEKTAKAIHDAWNISGVPYEHEYIKGNAFRGGKLEAQSRAAIETVFDGVICGLHSTSDPWMAWYTQTAGGESIEESGFLSDYLSYLKERALQ